MSEAHTAQMIEAWHAGKLTIFATMGEGPQAGGIVMCITPRAGMVRSLARVRRSLARHAGFLSSLRQAVRQQVLAGCTKLTPKNDHDFMGDLGLLMAAKLVAGDDVLEGSGVFSLLLAVDPDESEPWDRRGFVFAADVIQAPTEVLR